MNAISSNDTAMPAAQSVSDMQLLEAYRACEPEVQVIFMAYVRASFINKTVPHEVAFPRAEALIARFRAGGEVLISEIEAIGTP